MCLASDEIGYLTVVESLCTELKLEDTCGHLLILFHLQMSHLNMCTSTSLVLCLAVMDIYISGNVCKALPMTNIDAHTTAKTFLSGWVSRFGVQAIIIRDRGRQFESNLFCELIKLLGSKRIRTTTYHPE